MAQPAEAEAPSPGRERVVTAFFCVVIGALAMGISPIFVRLADVGPFASAFWRVALALPLLYAWAVFDTRRTGYETSNTRRDWRLAAIAGVMFACDLFFWHLAIMGTTVANATFLASMAPITVLLGSWTLLREPITGRIFLGLVMALCGAGFLLGSSYSFAPANLTGDMYGIITALFFGAYFLAVRPARRYMPAGVVVFRSTLVTAAILLVVALAFEERILPASGQGVVMLLCLALLSHAGGQGLLTYALGHLPAAFSSIVILIEGVAAAVFGWLILDERLTLLQFTGCFAIFAGIYIARPRRAKASPQSAANITQ